MNYIIGISGKIGTGKNLVADLIQKHSNIKFVQTAFAKKLKLIVALLCEIDYQDTLSQKAKNIYIPEYDNTIGGLYQTIGTDIMRTFYRKDVWIKSLLLELKNKPNNYIVTDVRFKNEAEALLNVNAILLRVERNNNETAIKSNRNLNHISETELDNYDKFTKYIYNNGTIKELEENIIKLLKSYNIYKKPNILKRIIYLFS